MERAGLSSAGLLALAFWLGAGCSDPEPYVCLDDRECDLIGGDARCEADGRCTYPDEGCPSGRRYGPYASAQAEACFELSGPVMVTADLSACASPGSEVSPTQCSEAAGPNRIEVDLSDNDHGGASVYAYLRFPAQPSLVGANVVSVRLEVTVPADPEDVESNAAGELVEVESFDATSLGVARPAILRTIAGDPGAVLAGAVLRWELPTDVVDLAEATHLALVPQSEDSAEYWGASGEAPPRLVIVLE